MHGSDASPPGSERPAAPPSDVPKLARRAWVRGLYAGLGLVCVGSAAVGVVLPGWPTTVWLLVAAFFFARSSPRFHDRLMRHRVFGPLLRDVRAGLGIPLRAKVLAVSSIVVFAGGSAVLLWARPWLSLLVASCAAIGLVVVLRQPTRVPSKGAAREAG